MIGQMTSFKKKQRLVDEFIERVNPYENPPSLHYDLRGYAKYLKDNKIAGKNVPEDIIKRFQR